MHRPGSLAFYRKSEHGAEAKCAHDSERVLGKTFVGDSDRADQLIAKVVLATVRIAYFARTRRHRVYREIPSCKIVAEASGERHLVGSAHIGIFPVASKRRYLAGSGAFAAVYHDYLNGGVIQSVQRIHRKFKRGHGPQRLLRAGRRRDIPIMRCASEK